MYAGNQCLYVYDNVGHILVFLGRFVSTAARCWESGIKGTMAGKTRVLVVNSQMLQRFASDSAVDRSVCDWSITYMFPRIV